MSPPAAPAASFERLGPSALRTPLVVSIPHAGREYPAALLERSALPVETLAALEDRHVDALAAGLPALGIATFVARRARAWIDLNRDEREIDAAMVVPPPRPGALIASAKVRGGLGLIPRRIAGAGEIMWQRLSDEEVAARVACDHRPWHDAIARTLAEARTRFGAALLLDLHSMPPIAAVGGQAPPRIVIGDRNGRSCARPFVDRLRGVAAAHGHRVGHNAPYAGGHTLDRHGRPGAAIHAVQVEVDRSLYLRQPDLREAGSGLAATAALIVRMAQALLSELGATGEPTTLAAE